MTRKRAFFDWILSRLASRKLIVWIVSTVALFIGILPPDIWMSISLGYIGLHALTDISSQWMSLVDTKTRLSSWKSKKPETSPIEDEA